jgi:hypothetical protein
MANSKFPIWHGKDVDEDVTQLNNDNILNILRMLEDRLARQFPDDNARREFMIWWHGILTLQACYRDGLSVMIAPPSEAYEFRMDEFSDWPMLSGISDVGDK